jgi:hypothetical protein
VKSRLDTAVYRIRDVVGAVAAPYVWGAMQTDVTFISRRQPLVVFPVALLAVVMCGVIVAIAPRPGQGHRADARWERPAAEAASPASLARVDVPAAR